MNAAAKYFNVAKITWKAMIAYQADTWLGAAVSGFRVLLALLLWQAIFAGRETVGGYTLPMMVTYSLFASMISRLQHQDASAWQLANEVREGTFSKYLVHPMPVINHFLGTAMGRWSYLLFINGAALAVWMGAFAHWLVLPSGTHWLWMLPLLPLGGLCMFLLNHAIALLSLKYQDVGGMMIMKGSFIEFFSGSLLPLDLLPVGFAAVLKYLPFYYVVYYPTSLFLGTQAEPPLVAVLVLLFWCAILYAFCQFWFARARKFYEGVGI